LTERTKRIKPIEICQKWPTEQEREREFGEMLRRRLSHCCSVRIKRTIASLLYCSRFVKQNKKEERNNQRAGWQWRPSWDESLGAIVCLSSRRGDSDSVFWANASFQYHPSVWSFDGKLLLQQIFLRLLVKMNILEMLVLTLTYESI
jgi:hypothetical protein